MRADPTRVCGPLTNPSSLICCPAGGTCCFAEPSTAGQIRCCPQNEPICCPTGANHCCRTASPECCGTTACCKTGEVCIGGQCCPATRACPTNNPIACCQAGETCCGTTCCRSDRVCCATTCCPSGKVCVNPLTGARQRRHADSSGGYASHHRRFCDEAPVDAGVSLLLLEALSTAPGISVSATQARLTKC